MIRFRFLPLLLLSAVACCTFSSCKNEPPASADSAKTGETVSPFVVGRVMADSSNETEELHRFYAIVADTGNNYAQLRALMFRVNSKTKIAIDTMRRTYDPKKNKITLAADDDDEIWAGEYYPRNFASEILSLEHLENYTDKTRPGTMTLIAGIYESRQAADSVARLVKPIAGKTFVMETVLYIGCMH